MQYSRGGLFMIPTGEKYIVLKCQRPLWVISGHTDMSASCPLYPQQQTLSGTSKLAFGYRFMSTRPRGKSEPIAETTLAIDRDAGLVSEGLDKGASAYRASKNWGGGVPGWPLVEY